MERKEIVKTLGEHFGVEPKYMGAPSFAYEIATVEETYIVDREGKIITSAGNDVKIESIINGKYEEETIKPTETETIGFEVTVPMDGHTGISLRNLVNMVYSKQTLIKKSIGITANIIQDDFCIGINEAKIETLEDFKVAIEDLGTESCLGIGFDFFDKIIAFKFLEDNANPEKIKPYTQFVALLSQSAKSLKRVSAKAKDTDNDKFTFRVFLIRLGMVGDEYKIARKVLLENLEGNSAFKDGKKPEKVTAE
jgi:hypothetical protein